MDGTIITTEEDSFEERKRRIAAAKNRMSLATYASTTPTPYAENRATMRARLSRLRRAEKRTRRGGADG